MNQRHHNILALIIILLSSLLLGVWATQHTIALRNSLLVIGSLLSLAHLLAKSRITKTNINDINLVPLILISFLFTWVLAHYLFLSQDPTLQLKELKSVWLRALLGVIIGWTAGSIILEKPKYLYLLGIGLVGIFSLLYAQYIPRVLATHQLFQYDNNGYIFYAKHNAVLIGTILISAAGGLLMDKVSSDSRNRWFLLEVLAILFSMLLPLYSYVFIFETKNGIGLALILCAFWLIVGTWFLFRTKRKITSLKHKMATALSLFGILVLIFMSAKLQFNRHPEWRYTLEDFRESVQIDKYPQWSGGAEGPPILASGRPITGNIFDRASWAAGGLMLIPEQPWGNGILHYTFRRALMLHFPNRDPQTLTPSSHSGWIEITLAFGFPALLCLWGSLLAVLYGAINRHPPFKLVTISLVLAIFCNYMVGELSTQHSIEILLFMIALLAGMAPVNQKSKIQDTKI